MTVLAIGYFLKVSCRHVLDNFAWRTAAHRGSCYAEALQRHMGLLYSKSELSAAQDGLEMQPARAGFCIALGKGPWCVPCEFWQITCVDSTVYSGFACVFEHQYQILTGLAPIACCRLVKPLWGFLSDAFPIAGYRRRSWLLIVNLIGDKCPASGRRLLHICIATLQFSTCHQGHMAASIQTLAPRNLLQERLGGLG